MAWIIDIGDGILRAISTKGIKKIEIFEHEGSRDKRDMDIRLLYKGDPRPVIIPITTTAKPEVVLEALMPIVNTGEHTVILLDDIIKRAELISKERGK